MAAESGVEVEGSLNGLVEGVGRDVLEVKCWTLSPLAVTTGEILDGRVPARVRLAGLLIPVSATGTRSGNPPCEGDSGTMDSGVDVPLTGGPQMLGERPDCPCSSRVRFEYSLEPWSCKGDPAPSLALPEFDMPPFSVLGPLNGEVVAPVAWKSSVGETPDKFRLSLPSGREAGAIYRPREDVVKLVQAEHSGREVVEVVRMGGRCGRREGLGGRGGGGCSISAIQKTS